MHTKEELLSDFALLMEKKYPTKKAMVDVWVKAYNVPLKAVYSTFTSFIAHPEKMTKGFIFRFYAVFQTDLRSIKAALLKPEYRSELLDFIRARIEALNVSLDKAIEDNKVMILHHQKLIQETGQILSRLEKLGPEAPPKA